MLTHFSYIIIIIIITFKHHHHHHIQHYRDCQKIIATTIVNTIIIITECVKWPCSQNKVELSPSFPLQINLSRLFWLDGQNTRSLIFIVIRLSYIKFIICFQKESDMDALQTLLSNAENSLAQIQLAHSDLDGPRGSPLSAGEREKWNWKSKGDKLKGNKVI